MTSNQNTFGQSLEKGLGGRSFKATFLLYVVNVLILGFVGYWLVTSFGEQRSFELLPMVVGAIVALEYGVHAFIKRTSTSVSAVKVRAKSPERQRALLPLFSTSMQRRTNLAVGLGLFHYSLKLPTKEEPVNVTITLHSLKSAYLRLIELLENKESKNKGIKHSIWKAIFKRFSFVTVLVDFLGSPTGFTYSVSANEEVENLHKRVAAIDSVLDLERKLRELGIEVTQIDQVLRKYIYSVSRRMGSFEESAHHQRDLQNELFALIIDKSPSKESSKPKALKREASAKRTTAPSKKTKKPQKSKKKKNYPRRKH